MPLVHDELHRLAHQRMAGERPAITLQTTALVNEAYLRLIDSSRVHWQNRAHFFAVSAQLMRRILVDSRARGTSQTRRRRHPGRLGRSARRLARAERRSGRARRSAEELAAFDERKSKIVELRFFGGLSVEETAEVLKVSPTTVMRDWGLAKAWLCENWAGRR